jgi:cation:H+ antiporter
MEVILWIIILVFSLIILFKSSDYFIDGAERLGLHFKINPFIIGTFVLGFGTSIPELVVSITSVIQKTPEIVAGNVLGSNISNILLVLGISAIIVKESNINFDFLEFDLPLSITSAFLLVATMLDGVFSAAEGIFFLVIFIIYIIYTISNQRKKKEPLLGELEEIKKEEKETITVPKSFRYNLKSFPIKMYRLTSKKIREINWFTVAKIVISPLFIYFSAKYAVEAVINISKTLKIGSDIISATVVALGTSLPELSVSYVTLRKGKIEEMFGNIVGSGIFNILLVMSIPALITDIVVSKAMINIALPAMMVATVILFIFAYDKKITRWEGTVLIILYLFYLGLIFGIF